MESVSSMEFSDVCWPAEPQRKDFQLHLSPETGPKHPLLLHIFSPVSAANKSMLSARSLGSSLSNGSYSLSNSFMHAAMSSSLNGLQGSYENLQNETKHSAELGKARETDFSRRLADLTSELTKIETKEASLSKAATNKSSGARTNKPTKCKKKSKSTRCSSRDKTKKRYDSQLEDTVDTSPPEPSSRRKQPSKSNAGDDSSCFGTNGKEDLESQSGAEVNCNGDQERGSNGRIKHSAVGTLLSDQNDISNQRSFRQRRASTNVLRRELSSRLPSGRRSSLTHATRSVSRRRVHQNVSASQVSRPRPNDDFANKGIETPRRVKSFDCFDRADLHIAKQSGVSPKAKESEGSNPFDTTGLSLVDKILIDDLWSDDSSIVLTAFCQLRAMCHIAKNERTVHETLHSGACSTLVGICRKWNSNTGIFLEALRLFGLLLEDNANDQFSLMVVRMGGLRLVLSAMEKYPRSEPILEHACSVLHALVSIKNEDPSISFVRDLKGLSLLLQTMKNHPSHVAINRQASLAFCSMAHVGSLRKHMEAGGGMVLVQRVLNDHEEALVNTRTAKTPHKNTIARGA